MRDVIIPNLGESITEATIAKWHKKTGDHVNVDDLLLEVETDKVTLEVNAPVTGVLSEVLQQDGSNVVIGQCVGRIDANAKSEHTKQSAPIETQININVKPQSNTSQISPGVRKMIADKGIDASKIAGTGKDGRITSSDVVNFVPTSQSALEQGLQQDRSVRTPMSRLRKTIAQRLKDSQNTAAILTTFNEIDMTNIMQMRQRYKDEFEKSFGVRLGFMSFFVKAVTHALKAIPAINAFIDGGDIVYNNYYNIGVAVGTENGLVVPVIRDADTLSIAQIEKQIVEFANKAKDGKLSIQDLNGGTFSISNGGTYGSLLSTPIINPPQSGILGMHKIQDRPVAIGGKVEVRSMMYVALSYDHRIVDGKEAVTFLVKVKEMLESPERMIVFNS